jgi:hypothetical protein
VSESIVLAVRPGPRVIVVQAPVPQQQAAASRPVEILSDAEPSRVREPVSYFPADGGAIGLKRQVLRFGLEGLPDPPPLLTQEGRVSSTLRSDSHPDAPLRRYEIDKVLESGGPS